MDNKRGIGSDGGEANKKLNPPGKPLTAEQKRARFIQNLAQQQDMGEVEDYYATSIFYIERELGVHIQEDYPLMKFLVQVEEMKKHYEKEKEMYEQETTGIQSAGGKI